MEKLIQKLIEPKFLNTLLNTVPILIIDESGVIVFASKLISNIFGYEDCTELNIEQLIPSHLREQHIKHRAAYNVNPVTRIMGHATVPIYGLRKDGELLLLEVGLSTLVEDGKTYVVATVMDTTEKVRHTLTRRESELKQIIEALKELIRA